MQIPVDWLLTASPMVETHTRREFLGQSSDDPQVILSRQRMIEDPEIIQILHEVNEWPGSVLISHKSAGHPIHKIAFLADIGMTASDPGINTLISRIIEHQDQAGPFQVLTNIPIRYGGDGKDSWEWGLCDAPLLLYALARFGLVDDPRVQKGINLVHGLIRDNGWPCTGATPYSTFRGPGRKDDPCPFVNLIMLKLLAAVPELMDTKASHLGVESLLHCWAERETYHPYIFYMGNDFCKLKAPLVWFDILHVTHVLSQFSWVKGDPRYEEMRSIIAQKADSGGKFTPESVWLAWKNWDFGQKKGPSPWLTFLAHRILQR